MSNNEEMQYLDILSNVMHHGYDKPNRTENKSRSITGATMRFTLHKDGKDIMPLITTKKVNFHLILTELLWFLRGETNSKTLDVLGNKIWNANGTREFLDSRGLTDYEEGDLGPIYGYQWRKWNKPYVSISSGADGDTGIDQIMNVIDGIKSDPWSRRHIVTAWNPEQLNEMALPPCVTGDTTLKTPEGNCLISDIKIGTKILTQNGDYATVVQKFITSCINKPGFLISCDDHPDSITVTTTHKMMYKGPNSTNYNWTEAKTFEKGGYLHVMNDNILSPKKIKRITKMILNENVYDIGLDIDHTYIANGYVNHNCHSFFQFVVRPNADNMPHYLDCVLHQRSGDLPLGVPFNIASYACLTHIMAKLTNLTAGDLVHNIADTHIYHNQFEGAEEQITRKPYKFPSVEINIPDDVIENKLLDDIKLEHFKIIDYKHHPFIRYPLSI